MPAPAPLEAVAFCDGSDYEVARAVCLHSLVRFVRVLRSSSWRLTETAVEECQMWGRRFLRLYVYLAAVADDRGLCLWQTRPKLHPLWHMVEDLATHINPYAIQNDADEAYLFVLKRMARQCRALVGFSRCGRALRARQRCHCGMRGGAPPCAEAMEAPSLDDCLTAFCCLWRST